jgi:hypothetical protein
LPKPTSIEERLEALERLANALDQPDTRDELRKHLGGKVSLLAAKAAALIGRLPGDREDLASELVSAFRRFMVDPVKNDKGCLAKIAIMETLLAIDRLDEDVLRIGIRHVQMEPVFGGKADTAPPLRALCGIGLVQVGAADALDHVAVLLADPEPDARLGAVRALVACGALATPLLRYKALQEEPQPLVIAECLSGLMTIAPHDSFEFIAALIDPEKPQVAPNAAMAIAESRLPGAFEVLEGKLRDGFSPEFRQSLLLPIAMTRSDAAVDLLVSVLEDGDLTACTQAISALAIYRGDPSVRARVEGALRGPHRGRLLGFVARVFDS